MQANKEDNRIFIISELHPQHEGRMGDLERMIMQSKLAGADAVKVQLYNTQLLHGNRDREYLQLDRAQLADLKSFADQMRIELFASVFDLERLGWCEELGFQKYKIASRTVADQSLCEAVIATQKPVFVSLGKWHEEALPFEAPNITYFYCVSQYPTMLEEISMPLFSPNTVHGYSDHSIGIGACLFAVSRGAQYLEKHFTLNKARQKTTEKAHLGAMDFEELVLLRSLVDDISALSLTEAK